MYSRGLNELSLGQLNDGLLHVSTTFTVWQNDPTFDIFTEQLSLTVSTYGDVKLLKEDSETYSKFGYTLTSENSSLDGLLASGTDRENVLTALHSFPLEKCSLKPLLTSLPVV